MSPPGEHVQVEYVGVCRCGRGREANEECLVGFFFYLPPDTIFNRLLSWMERLDWLLQKWHGGSASG